MKFAAVAVLSFATGSAASALPNVWKGARRLQDNNDQDEYAFLADYSVKLITCKANEPYTSPDNQAQESSSVVFRLCPTLSECSDEGHQGCSSGYGDYVVGLNSFVKEYLETKRDEMQGDDDTFKVNELGECRQYKADGDGKNNGDEAALYYVGPACTEDGTGVRVMMFSDQYCSTPSESTFADISNGLSLPYADGGLVSNYCESCFATNNKGEYELARMCTNLYADAGKCEDKMETFHYAGQQVDACEFIQSIMPIKAKAGAGKVIGWLFFVAFVIGGGYVAYTMFKKKDEKTHTLMNA